MRATRVTRLLRSVNLSVSTNLGVFFNAGGVNMENRRAALFAAIAATDERSVRSLLETGLDANCVRILSLVFYWLPFVVSDAEWRGFDLICSLAMRSRC